MTLKEYPRDEYLREVFMLDFDRSEVRGKSKQQILKIPLLIHFRNCYSFRFPNSDDQ
jgi:hypothetical protein